MCFGRASLFCVRDMLRMRVKTLGTGGHPLCERRYWFYIYGSSDCFVSFMIFFVLKNYGGIIQCEGTTVLHLGCLFMGHHLQESFFDLLMRHWKSDFNSLEVSEIYHTI